MSSTTRNRHEIDNAAYTLTFEAVELAAAAGRIDFRGLHHRYHSDTACCVLRAQAARRLRDARQIDAIGSRIVWRRHRPQTRGV